MLAEPYLEFPEHWSLGDNWLKQRAAWNEVFARNPNPQLRTLNREPWILDPEP